MQIVWGKNRMIAMNKENEMSQLTEMPLISMLILTYNFEKYVGATLAGALAQDYSNLEIVISDDCSSDATWAIITALVGEYRRQGGDKKILLNQNKKNMGFIPHFEHAKSLCKGDLIVYNDGDDVSHVCRVSEIVSYWNAVGRSPWVIFSGALKVDRDGYVIGKVRETGDNESILGSVSTYRRGLENVFGPISDGGASQDEVYGNRALMLGPRGSIEKPLLKYRIGSGESSGFYDYRARRIKILKTRGIGSQRQLLLDIEVVKDRLGEAGYIYWKKKILRKKRQNEGMLELLEGNSLAKRYHGFTQLDFRKSIGQRVLYAILLLPHCMADAILAVGSRIVDSYHRRSRRMCEW